MNMSAALRQIQSRLDELDSKLNVIMEHFTEEELVNRKLDRLNHEIKTGKSRLLTPEEALGKYAKLLKR